MNINQFDNKLIHFFRKVSWPMARFSLFVVFFWFGILKVLGFSPASGLVKDLLASTIPFMSPDNFVVLFGWFEMLIGVLFLLRGAERIVIPLLFFHMVTTVMPLFFLPTITWTYFMVPTLEGQYIIKNLVIITTAIFIAAHLHPMKISDNHLRR